MSYIKTGWSKYLLSPKKIRTEEMEKILDEIDFFEEKLDNIRRTEQWWYHSKTSDYENNSGIVAEVRSLRKTISKLYIKFYKLDETTNPEYYKYWNITWKDF